MKPTTFDETRIKDQARSNSQTTETQLKWWWVERFNLPPTDPRFLNATLADHLLCFYEDMYNKHRLLKNAADEGQLDNERLKDMRDMEQDLFHDQRTNENISVYGEEIIQAEGVRNTANTTPFGRAYYVGDPVIDAIEEAIGDGDDEKAARLIKEWDERTK